MPCLNPSRPCMMMPMINCERRGTRLWNYGESSRERIFLLAKTAITCINGVKFEASQQLKFFRLYIWDFFHEKMRAHHGHYGGMSTNQSKLLQKEANFVWKCHASHLPFFDLLTKLRKKMDENCAEVIFGSLLSFFYTIDRIHPSLYQIFTEYRRGRTQALHCGPIY